MKFNKIFKKVLLNVFNNLSNEAYKHMFIQNLILDYFCSMYSPFAFIIFRKEDGV